jgi:hypothetical protein
MSEPLESRVARVEEWSEGHEERCEDRYQRIHETVGEIKSSIKAMLGWGALQIYQDLKEDAQPQYAPPAISDHP